MIDKYELVCKQFGSLSNPNPPMHIDWMPTVAWNLLFEEENVDDVCLTYLYVENEIGIVHRNKKGYVKTPCYIYEGVNGAEAVNWFNEHILGLSLEESTKIIFSTFQ